MSADTLYLVRHAKAGDRSKWDGDDRFRPLTKPGWRQSEALAQRIHDAVGVRFAGRLVSSPYVRCRQTLEPLATLLNVDIEDEPRLAEGYDREGVLELVHTLPHHSVMCSHGDVIPDVMAALQRRGTELANEPDWRKATVWVLDRTNGHVSWATCWPPPELD
jgi:8-oxo-dGTP diphosphatase